MTDMLNPAMWIMFILNFAKSIIDFMNYQITIPGLATMSIWQLVLSSLGVVLGWLIVKRMFL